MLLDNDGRIAVKVYEVWEYDGLAPTVAPWRVGTFSNWIKAHVCSLATRPRNARFVEAVEVQ